MTDARIDRLLLAYLMDDMPRTEPDEDWDDVTAVECPCAIREGRVVKRSGEFLSPGFWIEDEEFERTG